MGDADDRLAQVVGHEVGEVAQLGLVPPLLGDVGQDDEQPVAEARDALDEGAEHVAVAERGVVDDLADPGPAGLAERPTRERAAAAHPGERLQQRVAVAGRRGQPEPAQHHGVAVAQREVHDRRRRRATATGCRSRPGIPPAARGTGGAPHPQQRLQPRVGSPPLYLDVGDTLDHRLRIERRPRRSPHRSLSSSERRVAPVHLLPSRPVRDRGSRICSAVLSTLMRRRGRS